MNKKQAAINNPAPHISLIKRPKVPFTKKEDQLINYFVNLIGTKKWASIAKFINGRTAKQCRDRYVNYLKPGITNIEWTKKEDDLLIELYNKHGPKWSIINKCFKNRNQISLKNRHIFLLKHTNEINHDGNIINNTNNKTKKNLFVLPKISKDEEENDFFDISNNSIDFNADEFIFNSEDIDDFTFPFF